MSSASEDDDDRGIEMLKKTAENLLLIGRGYDRRIRCRNCGEGGHYKERCSKPMKEFVSYCHICKVYGVGHDSLICPSRSLRCQRCHQFGHSSEFCGDEDIADVRTNTFWKSRSGETSYKRTFPVLGTLKQEKFDLDKILARDESELISFAQ